MSRPVSPINANERITEVSCGRIWIGKEVGCPRRAEVRAGHTKVSAATQAARGDCWNHVDTVGERPASEVPADHWERQTAVRPEHARNVPPADNLIEDGIVETELVPFARGQVIVEDGVEHVGPVEQGRPILKVGVETSGVGTGVVLNASQLIE